MAGALLARPLTATAQNPAAELDVPFVVTPDNVVLRMLDIAQVSARDFVLDLGSGDGRIVITAALRYGARALGVELDPNLVERSRQNAARAGVGARTEFVVRDLFETDLSQASVITMYLLPDVNILLRPNLLRLRPGVRLVSHDWDMGDWKPDHAEVVDAPDKPLGLQKNAKLWFWVVPAQLDGQHVGQDIRLTISQSYQEIRTAQLQIEGETWVFRPADVYGPTVILMGRDARGADCVLSASVNEQVRVRGRPGGEVRWQLRRAGLPPATLLTRASG